MNSQPPTNSTGPITKPAVTQSSNVSSEQGVLYKIFKLFKLIKSMFQNKKIFTHIFKWLYLQIGQFWRNY